MARFNLKETVKNSNTIIFAFPTSHCYEELTRKGEVFDLVSHSLNEKQEAFLRLMDDHVEYTEDMILNRFNKNHVCYDVVKVTLFHNNRKTKLGFVDGRLVSKETSIVY